MLNFREVLAENNKEIINMCYCKRIRIYALLLLGLCVGVSCSKTKKSEPPQPNKVEEPTPNKGQDNPPKDEDDAEDIVAINVIEGQLEQLLAKNIPRKLKLSGTLNHNDYAFLLKHSNRIEFLDLSDIRTAILPREVFYKSSFREVRLPKELRVIPHYAFVQSQIQRCIIPASVEIIEVGAFKGCASLKETLFIPASVRYIAPDAFRGCISLTEVVFEGSPEIKFGNKLEYEYLYTEGTFLTEAGLALPLKAVYSKSTDPKDIMEIAFWISDEYMAELRDTETNPQADFLPSPYGGGERPKVLYVPKGYKAKYSALKGWRVFQSIVEIDIAKMPSR